MKALRAAAEEAGRPDLLLANNEYGLVKPPTFAPDFDRYTKAMVVTEFALEMYVSGYDMAAFWDTSDGGHLDHSEHMLTDTSSSYRFNPMHFGLEFLGRSTNGTKVQMTSGEEQRVHGFAAVSGTSDSPVVIAYLLNKYAVPRSIQIEMEGIGTATGTARNATAESVVDTADHWGGGSEYLHRMLQLQAENVHVQNGTSTSVILSAHLEVVSLQRVSISVSATCT